MGGRRRERDGLTAERARRRAASDGCRGCSPEAVETSLRVAAPSGVQARDARRRGLAARSSTTSASTRRCASGCAASRRASAGCDPSVALVGARAATSYGDHVALELSADLAGGGIPVVSGGAYGIDGAAHRAALAVGGLDRRAARGRRRPRLPGRPHRSSSAASPSTGAVVSEVPCGSAPTKWRFLQRNRLIAALTVGDRGRRGGLAQRLAEHRRARRGARRAGWARCPARSRAPPRPARIGCCASSARSASRARRTSASCSGVERGIRLRPRARRRSDDRDRGRTTRPGSATR